MTQFCSPSRCLDVRLWRLGVAGLGLLIAATAQAAPIRQSFGYTSSVTSDAQGPLDLIAELNFDTSLTDAPIAVVMHPFSANDGTLENIRKNAERLRNQGFFAVSVAMRGRDGSDGVRDSGGLEIYDIFDAVEAVKAGFASQVNEQIVYITGYSGGGGNTMSALTKFPDYFNAGAPNVGMSDYGYDPVDGWYFNGAGSRTSILNADIGNRLSNDPAVIDRYHARASNLASKNNPYSEIHLFANTQETISPVINNTSFRDFAIAAASFPGEFDNITVHTGDAFSPAWVDHNGDGIQQTTELQNFPHSSSITTQDRMEAWFLNRLLAGEIPTPVLNDTDDLFVAGWVRTKRFELFLGDGQDAAGALSYHLQSDRATFVLDVLSHDQTKTGRLTLDTTAWAGLDADIFINDLLSESVVLGDTYVYTGLGNEQTLVIRLALLGDYNGNGSVEQGDLDLVLNNWGGTRGDWQNAAGFASGAVDQEELDRVLNYWGSSNAGSPSRAQAVPEPMGVLMGLGGVVLGLRRRVVGGYVCL